MDLLPTKKLVQGPYDKIVMLDVSEVYRPEGAGKENFRRFDAVSADPIMKRVYSHYCDMHQNQTVDFVKTKREEYGKFEKGELKLMDALQYLDRFVDETDPDVSLPNIVHAYQTAERIRTVHPDKDWMHLTGLIHDLGKVLAIWGEPQWCIGGDTYPVGCAIQPSVVFADCSFGENPDLKNEKYNSKYGMYTEECGIDQLLMIWGHDEYMYQVIANHPLSKLPEEALYMIRFHSFYPWHTGGDYWCFANQKDKDMYYWVKEFNKFDLYSKNDSSPDIEKIKPYYQSLVDKYLPGLIKF